MLPTSYGRDSAQGGTSKYYIDFQLMLIFFCFYLKLHFPFEIIMRLIQVLNQDQNKIRMKHIDFFSSKLAFTFVLF